MSGKLKVLSLFAGVGGFDLGLERTGGFSTVAFCEINTFCRRVLAKHWPEVPCYEDVRTLSADALARDGIAVDVICGGFPCTNVSRAAAAHGGNTSLDGEQSGLWWEYDRLIGEIQPRYVIIENVEALLGDGLLDVLRCLAARGYDAVWTVIPGTFVGAPQPRERVWIVAYARGERAEGLLESIHSGAHGQGWPGGQADLQDIAATPFSGRGGVPQPLLRGVDDRPANWVDRVRACGNAVIPQVVETIGRAILETRRAA